MGVLALLLRALFTAAGLRGAFREFAGALELILELALVLLAMAFTGGVGSPFHALLFVELLLVRALGGAAASRFACLAALLGLALLAGIPPQREIASLYSLLGLAGRVLWPLPVLAAMELGVRASAPSTAAAPPSDPAASRSGILHDLKSPLSVIRVYADLIAERFRRGEPPLEEHVRNLDSEVELMETLVGAAPGRRPAEPSAPAWTGRADLVRIVGALAESYRLAHPDLTLEFAAESAEAPVQADVIALQRVFRNVLDNAVKFTPPGGTVRVRVGGRGRHAYVSISDTGVGMTPEERERAFEMAYRGPAARTTGKEGQGLGLAVSRQLVEANGGTITLSSEQGQGSEVTVRLPLAGEGPS